MNCSLCRKVIGPDRPEDGSIVAELKLDEDTHVCLECAHKHRVDHAVKELKPAFDKLFDQLNGAGNETNKIAIEAIERLFFGGHRYLQNELGVFLYNILTKIGSHSGDVCYEDQRNQWVLAWARGASKVDVYFKDETAHIELRG